MADSHRVARDVLRRRGQTYADEAGIGLADRPAPLYQLLVLSTLLSARITASVAVAAAVELFAAGMRTPRAMVTATWQERVDALGRGHYRRYDERTSTMLGEGARLCIDEWRGDLRRLHAASDDRTGVHAMLQAFPGIGPVGADIFLREVQAVWADVRPFFDAKAVTGARVAGLPDDPETLAGLVASRDIARFAAALVRVGLDRPRRDR